MRYEVKRERLWCLWLVQSDNVGWRSFLQEDPTEFQDIPLHWEEATQVPSWLSGTYVRWVGELSPLIGRDPSRYCALIGWDHALCRFLLQPQPPVCRSVAASRRQSDHLQETLNHQQGRQVILDLECPTLKLTLTLLIVLICSRYLLAVGGYR